MDLRVLTDKDKKQYNKLVTHVIQSWEWGDFRKSIGTPLERYGIYEKGQMTTAFQITFHPIPLTDKFLGYIPKGPLPNQQLAEALIKIGQKKNCAFIKVEPDILKENLKSKITKPFIKSPKSLFTKYNFLLDLTQSEEQILKKMHPKTRYNIRVAEKKGVTVEERTDDKALDMYLKLYFDTTARQGFHGHNIEYHQKVWHTFRKDDFVRLLIAFYSPKGASSAYQKKPLTAWMLFNFKDTLFYAYGGSSVEHREVMSNNLVAWEAIKLGKKLKLKYFDMWGAAHSPNPTSKDPHYGFHRFKSGFGGELVEYIGTFDIVFNQPIYQLVTFIDQFTNLKVFLLKLLGK